MAKGLVSDTSLTAIGNAIRAKNGSSDTYRPSEMAGAIEAISTVDEESALQYMLNHKTNYTGIAAGLTTLTSLPEFTQPSDTLYYTSAFSGCSSLTSVSGLYLAQNETSETPTRTRFRVSSMFDGCSNLTSIPTFGDYALYVGEDGANYMFRGCSKIVDINLPAKFLSFGSRYPAESIFDGCTKCVNFFKSYNGHANYILNCIPGRLARAFNGCSSLVSIYLDDTISGSFVRFGDRTSSNSFLYTFNRCSKLERIELADGKTEIYFNPSTMENMFSGCTRLVSLPTLVPLNSSPCSAASAFYNCSKIVTVLFGSPLKVSLAGSMFYQCSKLETVSGVDFSNCISVIAIFAGCVQLDSLPFNPGDLALVTDFRRMCDGCTSLTTVPVFSMASCSGTTNHQNMFANCPNLTNASLNNILAALTTKGQSGSTNKTLKYVGLSSTQATTCTGLSNWTACQAAGWTTGY